MNDLHHCDCSICAARGVELRVLKKAASVNAQRAQFSDEQLDRAAFQLFCLDNMASRWPSVNQVHYRKEAKSILDAAFSSTDDCHK